MKSKLIAAGLSAAVFLGVVASAPAASAEDWVIEAKVTMVEPSYLPNSLDFMIDTAGGNCPAGAFLTWIAKGANDDQKQQNNTAVYSALVTALAGGKRIRLYGFNNGCTINYIWIFP